MSGRARVLAQYPRGSAKIAYVLDDAIARLRDDCVAAILDHPAFFLGPLAVRATPEVLDRFATDSPKILHYVTLESPADLLTRKTFASSLRYAIVFRDPLDETTIAVYVPGTGTVRMYEDGMFGIVFPIII